MEVQNNEKRKCNRCNVNLPIDFFTLRRSLEYNKLCNDCLKKKAEKQNKIIRTLPEEKRHVNLTYEKYYTRDEIMNVKQMNNNIFTKWFNGINPITNRKVKINGETHTKLQRELGFKSYSYYDEIYKIDDIEKYLHDSDQKKRAIQKEKDDIHNHNIKIKEVIKKILELKDWGSFVVFDDKEYGLPAFYNNTHYENNCYGSMKNSPNNTSCTCHLCEDWGGCGKQYATHSMECQKCGAIDSFKNFIGRNYKGK